MENIVFLTLIGVGIIFSFIRMVKGPTAADRAVAVDTLSTSTAALLVLLGFIFQRYVYLDISLVYSILTFIGVIVIARFLEKGF